MSLILTEKQTERLIQTMKKYWVSRANDQDIKDLLAIGYKLKAFTDKINLRYQEAGIDEFWDVMCESGSLGYEIQQFKHKKGGKDMAFDILLSCQQMVDLWITIRDEAPETREEVARVGLENEYDEIIKELDNVKDVI